jgi:signal transduction histidine kinase
MNLNTNVAVVAPLTSVLFILSGLSLILIDKKVYGIWIAQFISVMSCMLVIPSILSYLYQTQFIYNLAHGTQVSIPSLISAVLVLIAILISRLRHGFMTVIISKSAGGFMARRLLLLSVLLPLILGWLLFNGKIAGIYNDSYQFLLFISLTIFVFTIFIWNNAISLDQIDLKRKYIEDNLLFLNEASKILSTSLNYKKMLDDLSWLSVSRICDWCTIEMLNKNGELELLSIAHKNKSKIRLALEFRKNGLLSRNPKEGVVSVVHSGKSILFSNFTDSLLQKVTKTPKEFAFLKSLGFTSVMIVAIKSGEKSIGAMQFVSAEKGRKYNAGDLSLAEELASRIGLSVQNASLYLKAKEAIQIRDDFMSVASHELKTPLTSLTVYNQLLEKKLQDINEISLIETTRKMGFQIKNLTSLISDLLDLSRLQVDKLIFRMEKFDLNLAISEVVADIQTTTSRHTIVIEGHAEKYVYGDKNRIGQVLINLLTNAIKYSPESDKVIVYIENDNQTKKVIVKVQDFGVGIQKKFINRIFNRFYQVTDPIKKTFPGLGIGLFISQQIMKRHKNKIIVESTVSKGSIFSFALDTEVKKN